MNTSKKPNFPTVFVWMSIKEDNKNINSRQQSGFFKKLNHVEVGGKTGTLTGYHPKGKHDWFVGYLKTPDGKGIAVAALTIHINRSSVKSATLVRRVFEKYLTEKPTSVALLRASPIVESTE